MSLSCATPYRRVIPKPPLVVDVYPRYGAGAITDFNDPVQMRSFLNVEHTDPQANPKFYEPDVGDETFFYYMAPVEYGAVTFRSDAGLVGGWDGASWPLDEVGDEYGPVEITYQGRRWNLYRTDFPGNPASGYTVSFANG